MITRLKLGLVLISVLALLALIPLTSGADEGVIDLTQITPEELTMPLASIRNRLSGRSWLVTTGQDPAMGIGLDGGLSIPSTSIGGSPQQQAGGGAALVPFRDPSAKFSRNILIPSDYSQFTFQTEPSIAVDPNDPDHLLVGMIDYNFPNMVTYSSIDGGATWEGPNRAKYPRESLGSAGDPIVAFDQNGNAYFASISLDVEEFTIGPLVGTAVVSAISVARSDDGGLSWVDPLETSRGRFASRLLPSTDGRIRGEIEIGFLDKPWMAIGPDPDDPSKDNIYIVYTNFIQTASVLWIDELPTLGPGTLQTVIELVRSEDGGVTWSDPIEVSPRALFNILVNPPEATEPESINAPPGQEETGQAVSSRQIVQGPDVAVAPDGTVYVSWMDSTNDDSFEGLGEIHVARSENGGESFQTPRRASGFLEPKFRSRDHVFRSWASAFPKLALGSNDEVYVLWVAVPSDNPNDDGDVFFVKSTDKGRNWSRRLRVNDDETNAFQFFPEMAIDPEGNLHAMWGDFRDDPQNVSYHIYYATSEDGGESWGLNSRVTDFPSNPNQAFPSGQFIGDYFAIEATEDDVYMVWADSRLGEFGGLNQKIGFARQELMPSPSIFISPPSGPGGKDVVIQGFNFQPDRNVFIEVAGVIVSTTRTNDEGRFTSQIFVPISGEGAHTVRAIEESGNLASSSFFMDFGFDNIQEATEGIEELSQLLEGLDGGDDEGSTLSEDIRNLFTAVEELKAIQDDVEDDGGASPLLIGLLFAAGLIPIIGVGALLVIMLRRSKPAATPT